MDTTKFVSSELKKYYQCKKSKLIYLTIVPPTADIELTTRSNWIGTGMVSNKLKAPAKSAKSISKWINILMLTCWIRITGYVNLLRYKLI